MGFWKSLGKAALNYGAPIAAGFIPGMGPMASMAIGGGIGAATNAVNAGKGNRANAALQGGITGAASGYAGGKAKQATTNKGIGPTSTPTPKPANYGGGGGGARPFNLGNIPEGTVSDIPGRFGGGEGSIPTIQSRSIFNPRQVNTNLGNIPERSVADIPKVFGAKVLDKKKTGAGGIDWTDLIMKGGTAAGALIAAKKISDASKPADRSNLAPEDQYGAGSGRELRRDWSTFGQGKDQRAPNLADTLSQGRRAAVKSQPWRDPEYDRTSTEPIGIYPTGKKRKRKTEEAPAEE